VLGAQLSDFSVTFATANNKPSPIAGVLSVTAYALPDPKPTPSNWVAGAAAVPEPGLAWLLGCGLVGIAAARRKRA
jgi:threonine dehydrogenase-like Zn-dependent dehydrogenase